MCISSSAEMRLRDNSQLYMFFQWPKKNLIFFAKWKQLQKDSCGSGEQQQQTQILYIRIRVCESRAGGESRSLQGMVRSHFLL